MQPLGFWDVVTHKRFETTQYKLEIKEGKSIAKTITPSGLIAKRLLSNPLKTSPPAKGDSF